MRLRDDPQPQTSNTSSTQQSQPATTTRQTRKRKTPPSSAPAPPPPPPQQHPPPPPPPGIHLGQMLPPPHALIPPGMGEQQLPGENGDPSEGSPKSGGRQLSQSKRAEQNRKAQRAFRERRDQRVKALESRSQLLDAALASADEANRRWEECRALVDQLRIENATLRAALNSQGTAKWLARIRPNVSRSTAAATATSSGYQTRKGKGGYAYAQRAVLVQRSVSTRLCFNIYSLVFVHFLVVARQ
ncbi:hypothetical protein JVU11DRAFT_2648 [Chiua virens]|nr:hypothetical protein JVU11DRAFT_2648 [Chiua virens]